MAMAMKQETNTIKKSPSSSSSSKKSSFSRFCSKLSVKKGKKEEEEERVIKNGSFSSPLSITIPNEAPSSSSRTGKSECFERVFTYFDEDGDGRVSPAELQRGVRAGGGELTAEEAEMAVRLSDSDGDGLLGLEDFTKMMEGKDVEDEELKEAFKMYEMEGTGQITPKSLKRMLSRLGESTTTESCKAMIMRFDINGDGVLSFEEFKVMMMQQA